MDQFARDLFQSGETVLSNFLLKNYRKIGLSNEELLLYVLIKRHATLVVPMPEITKLQELTGYSQQELFELFHQMIQKKLAKITKVEINHQPVDAYDFTPMYEKLALLNEHQEKQADTSQSAPTPAVTEQQRQSVFESIEKEFGRTLSPLEMESISQWIDLDHYSPKIIELALKEAVLSQVYNLKYMDRILRSWEQMHLTTPQQIEENARKRRMGHTEQETPYKGPKIPFIKISDPNRGKDKS